MNCEVILKLILSFGKIGIFSLGGGNSMLQLIESECVSNHHWLTQDEFSLITGASFIFPGLTAVKIAAMIGYKVAGLSGLLASVLAINIPGIIFCILFINFIYKHQENFYIKNLIIYIKYGAVALLAASTYSVLQPLLVNQLNIKVIIYGFILFGAIAILRISPFYSFLVFLGACFIL